MIYGSNDHEHDQTLHAVLDRARKVGMRFNPDKCYFKQDSMTFYGVKLTKDGVMPDPKKLLAMRNLPEPKTIPLLESLLGIVNYLSRFSPNISKMTTNFRALLKKDDKFSWPPHHTTDFHAIKEELCSAKCLKYYEGNKKLYMEVDASQEAIDMALFQSLCENSESEADECQQDLSDPNVKDKDNFQFSTDLLPVAYGSKILTDAESIYANIEHELLIGVVARLEKFHTFCYGRSTTVLTNHKPLTFIIRKDLINALPRLQRLLL